MQIQEVTFEDFSGNIVTDKFYFHLTKAEILRFEMERKGGLTEMITDIIETEDNRAIYAIFERVVLASYGVKVGERFIKNEELRDAFSATNAYSEFIISLIQDAAKGAKFIDDLIPKQHLTGLPQNQKGMTPQEAARRRSEQTMEGFRRKQESTPKHQSETIPFDDANVSSSTDPQPTYPPAPMLTKTPEEEEMEAFRAFQASRAGQVGQSDSGLSFN